MEEWLGKLLGIKDIKITGDTVLKPEFTHAPDLWVIVLVLIPLLVGFTYFMYRKERQDVSPRAKVVMGVFRALILLLMMLTLFGPILAVETYKSRSAYAVVLLDESESMKVQDKYSDPQLKQDLAYVMGITDDKKKPLTVEQEDKLKEVTRMDIVKKTLANPKLKVLDKLNEKFMVQFHPFSNTIRSGFETTRLYLDVLKIEPVGTETAIGDSMQAALDSLRSQSVAAVVLFSDGKNTKGNDPVEIARQRRVPVYTVCPGIPQELKDIELAHLEAKDLAIVKDPLDIKFRLRAEGFQNEKTNITLTELEGDEKYLAPLKMPQTKKDLEKLLNDPQLKRREISDAKKEVTIKGKTKLEEQDEHLTYKPEKPGHFLLVVQSEVKPNEVSEDNNFLIHKLRVVDNKVRVLYVDSYPRWEYRYLRNALIRDTTIYAHTWLVHADAEWYQEHTPNAPPPFDKALKVFPGDLEDLLEYDVVIIGDVRPQDLGGESRRDKKVIPWQKSVENIAKFVSDFGGGVIFLAGDQSNPYGFSDTPFLEMLPVYFDPRSKSQLERGYSEQLRYRLTDQGAIASMALTKLLQPQDLGKKDNQWDAEVFQANKDFWEWSGAYKSFGLERIRWYAPTKIKEGVGVPLVEIIDPRSRDERSPLFADTFYGRGRVFFSATDESWIWRKYVDDRYFYRFWRSAISWAREGRLYGTKRFRVFLDKTDRKYGVGEKVKLEVEAYTRDFKPLGSDPEQQQIDAHIIPPAGDEVMVRLSVDKNDPKKFTGSYAPTGTGNYKVWVGETGGEQATEQFDVILSSSEFVDPRLDEDKLKEISMASRELTDVKDVEGKYYFRITDIEKLIDKIRGDIKPLAKLSERQEAEIWSSPLLYLLFALFITSEWILRKIFRLL